MNKHFGRFLTLALSLVMLVSLVPVAAAATDVHQSFYGWKDEYYDDTAEYKDAKMNEKWGFWLDETHYDNSKDLTVKAEDYDKYVNPWIDSEWGVMRDIVYERVGMGYEFSDTKIVNDNKSITIPAFPENGTQAEQDKWFEAYGDYDWDFENDCLVIDGKDISINYMPHTHDLSGAPWFFDNNFHWKNCTQCKQRVFLRWHNDADNDGICDDCGNAIHYYNITVKDTTGGKVTVSADKGAMNDVVNVTVTPDAGYHLESLKFYNNNNVHSQLTRWEDVKDSEYHFVILNWDIEVEATFVKD